MIIQEKNPIPLNNDDVMKIIRECINILKSMGYYYDYDMIIFKKEDTTKFIAQFQVPSMPNNNPIIVISSYEIENVGEDYDIIKNDILHELLHYIDFEQALKEKRIWWDFLRGWCKKSADKTTFTHKGNWKEMAQKVSSKTGLNISRTGAAATSFQNQKTSKAKYALQCKGCGQICAMYQKKSKIVQQYMNGEDPYLCSDCGSKLELIEM